MGNAKAGHRDARRACRRRWSSALLNDGAEGVGRNTRCPFEALRGHRSRSRQETARGPTPARSLSRRVACSCPSSAPSPTPSASGARSSSPTSTSRPRTAGASWRRTPRDVDGVDWRDLLFHSEFTLRSGVLHWRQSVWGTAEGVHVHGARQFARWSLPARGIQLVAGPAIAGPACQSPGARQPPPAHRSAK